MCVFLCIVGNSYLLFNYVDNVIVLMVFPPVSTVRRFVWAIDFAFSLLLSLFTRSFLAVNTVMAFVW